MGMYVSVFTLCKARRKHTQAPSSASRALVASLSVGDLSIVRVGNLNPLIAVASASVDSSGDGKNGIIAAISIAASTKARVEVGCL